MRIRLTPVAGAIVCGGLFAAGLAQPRLHAQDGRSAKMLTLSVWDILYLMTGGSNTLALMRDDGVVLVDTKPAGWGKTILHNVEEVTEKPVATIINTHAHPDHVGGNVELPTATTIVAHANARARMEKMEMFRGANAKFLPNTIVTDRMTLLDGADRIDLYYFGKGHTDGDLVVVFPGKNLAHFGDLFPAKALPVIDTASGGSGVEFPETLARAVAELKNITRVTTGHDEARVTPAGKPAGSATSANPRPMTWTDLEEYVAFNKDFVAAVRQAIASGQTAEQAAAALKIPNRYAGYDISRTKENVQAIYRELGR